MTEHIKCPFCKEQFIVTDVIDKATDSPDLKYILPLKPASNEEESLYK